VPRRRSPFPAYAAKAVLGDILFVIAVRDMLEYDAARDAWRTHRAPASTASW
jgi:hypothetical protein